MEVIEGDQAFATARRRARFSRYDWVAWFDRSGMKRAARISPEAIKSAMLAAGTQGSIVQYQARTGTPCMLTWWMANNVRRQLINGWR